MAHRMCVLFGRCQSAHVSLPATIGVHVGQSAHIDVLATAALATNAPSLRHTCLRRPSICFPSAPVDLLAVSFPDHRRHRCASHQHLPISWPPSSSIVLMLLEVNVLGTSVWSSSPAFPIAPSHIYAVCFEGTSTLPPTSRSTCQPPFVAVLATHAPGHWRSSICC